MAETDALEKSDARYQSYLIQGRWLEAVQNRRQSAMAADQLGRTDLFCQYFKEAIDLAKEHGLHNLEISTRIARYQTLLMRDLTNQTLDELGKELDCGYELKGKLSDDLKSYADAALAAYDQALTSSANPSAATIKDVKLASEKATAFSLGRSYEFQEILEMLRGEVTDRAKVGEQIRDLVEGAHRDTIRIRDELRVDLFLLAADLMSRRKSNDIAEMLFQSAETLSQSMPRKRWSVYMAWAGFWESLGNLAEAKDYAGKAVKAAKETNLVALQAQATDKLNNLLARVADAGSPSPTPAGVGATERVMGILELAQQALLSRNFDDALGLIDKALEEAGSSPLRRQALARRATAFIEQDRLGKAERDLTECISLLSAELDCDLAVASGALDGRIIEEELLFLLKAFVKARRGTEAWECAEKGRSGRLKREIEAAKRFVSPSLKDTTFASTSKWLRSERAAIVSFASTRWGTLALTAGPDDDKPEAEILDEFPSGELNRILVPDGIGADGSPEDARWDSRILSSDVVTHLSAGLIHPLSNRLRAITKFAKVLYIIPHSALYYAPFAALTLDPARDSQALIDLCPDLCPLAFTPSTAILLWFTTERAPASSHECLAVGVGESGDSKFHDHLDQIRSAAWSTPPEELRDEAATIETITAQAPRYSVLYFSCHGTVSEESRDLMASSELVLAGEKLLSARDVAKWDLHAKLVFLNACQSGRFRQTTRSDVNGFVRAFLLAGATSLIAPLIHVHPQAAGDLAQTFFQEWLRGASTSEALRAAQFAARKNDPQNIQWATYSLTGDFR